MIFALLCLLAVCQVRAFSSCAPSQVLLGDSCVECASLFGNCFSCSFSGDSVNSLQCDSCSAALYLLRAPAENLKDPLLAEESVSICVAKCEDFAYNYASDDNRMTCEYCGAHCSHCSPQYGCLDSYYQDHGFRLAEPFLYPASEDLFSSVAPSAQFRVISPCDDGRCDICQEKNAVLLPDSSYKQCDSCF